MSNDDVNNSNRLLRELEESTGRKLDEETQNLVEFANRRLAGELTYNWIDEEGSVSATKDDAARLPEDELPLAVYDLALAILEVGESSRKTTLDDLPPGVRMVYLLSVLDGQVQNGGFPQYFWNEDTGRVEEIGSWLDAIGASDVGAVVKTACDRYRALYTQGDSDNSEPSPDDVIEQMEEFDEAYYEAVSRHEMWAKMAQYISKHPAEIEYPRR